MKTEKIITSQAKNSLKGKWILIISSFLFICVVLLFLYSLQTIALIAMDTVNYDTGEFKDGSELLLFATDVVFFAALLFLSPLFNGFIKICYDTAQKANPDISLLFSYFSSPALYLRTVLFNFLPMLILSVLISVYQIGIMSFSLSDTGLQISEQFGIILLNLIVLLINIAFLLIFLLIFFFFIHFALFLYADNCNKGITYYYSKGFAIGAKHIGSTIKLFFRFIGWILLCFFVVPAFYVLPYFAVSFATSAKWLISLEKDRGLL